MEQAGVGALAIVDDERVVGILTDRDLVRRGISRGLPLNARVDSVMTTPVYTIQADLDLHEAFEWFRNHKVRRLVVTRGDKFAGMLSIDDLLIDLSADLTDLARPIRAEVFHTQHDAPMPVPT
jgi:CBS domain-containing protein